MKIEDEFIPNWPLAGTLKRIGAFDHVGITTLVIIALFIGCMIVLSYVQKERAELRKEAYIKCTESNEQNCESLLLDNDNFNLPPNK